MPDQDPWLPKRQREWERLARAEGILNEAARAAMRRFLRAARAALLGEEATTADAGPEDLPPNLDVWPDQQVWANAVATWITPASGRIFTDGYWQAMPDDVDRGDTRLSDADYAEAFMRETDERMTGAEWPDRVYDSVRREIAEARENGESIPETRKRIAKVLDLEHWDGSANVIARTESIAALNGGHYEAGRRRQEVFGETLFKQWLATADDRTRPSHRAVNGTVVPADGMFDVGGVQMRYPHDPAGGAAETVQCRCVLQWVDAEEAGMDLPSTEDTEVVTAAGGPGWAESVIAAAPELPPAEWFTDPQLGEYVRGIRVTDEGRVYGHIAPWDVEHESMPGVTAPRHGNDAAYAKFHRHPVMTAAGDRVMTGPLSTARLGEPKGHADLTITIADVMDHYDDPSFIAADVVAGEDEHGIWCSGALRPGVTPFQVHMLSRYSISGDWRNGELIAACSVTSPGFNKPADEALAAAAGDPSLAGQAAALPFENQPRAVVASDGHVSALVAAGLGTPAPAAAAPAMDGWTLYRQFKQAQAADQRITAARRRLSQPRAAVAAARVRKER